MSHVLERRQALAWRRIFGVGVLLCVVLCFAAAAAALNEWRNTYAAARRSAEIVAKSYAVHLGKVLANADALTGVIRYEYDRSPTTFNLRSLIDGAAITPDSAAQVTIVGADGQVLQTWPHELKNPVYLSDRPHFVFHKNNPDAALFIGSPVKGRVSGDTTIQFSRRLDTVDGRFAGVVVTSEHPDYLSQGFLSRANVGEHGALTAFLSNGTLLARSQIGAAASAVGPDFSDYLEKYDTRTGELIDPVDRSARIFAYAPVEGHPVIAAVALSTDEVMLPFYTHVWAYIASALLLSLFVLGATFLAMWYASRLISAEEKMRSAAETDPLTELQNRRSLREAIDAHCAGGSVTANSLAILTLDLRDFGRVNDLLGQDAGDALLRLVADRLRGVAADDMLVARVGGDEFSLLIYGDNALSKAFRTAGLIVEAFLKAFGLRGHTYLMNVAIGVASLEHSPAAGSELWRNANRAMAEAKHEASKSGESAVRVYTDAMAHRLDLDDDDFRALLLAMERREIAVRYAPIVSAASRQLTALRGSLFWSRSGEDARDEAELHELADRHDLLFRLGTYQLSEMCARDAISHIPTYAVVPAAVVLQGDLDQFLVHIEETRAFDYGRLRLGISQPGDLIGHPRAIQTLRQLRERGIEIYAANITGDEWSISIVRLLPLAGVEVGAQLLAAAAEDRIAESMLSGILTTCAELDLTIQVAGVSSEAQLNRLKDFPNVVVYGSLFSAEEFVEIPNNLVGPRGHES
ncbi:diguanylate cyclase domain-containing protein [Burkholderia cenocepacia]|uniref:diguanylate cyclase domain-containing protein n=1 Tax=Burkholderia cenocepacia TaxID=95486 RepID=UPI002B243124|nr:diguanylate cyclase [Burkholderia cenocepacia]MEB2558760.1 diguanylate cyclase [Burkholderia cenocepacia]